MPHKDPKARKAYRKAYYQANKKEFAAYNKAYRKSHNEECRKLNKAYYEKNKERDRPKKKAYAKANSKRISEGQKRWREKKKEHLRVSKAEYSRTPKAREKSRERARLERLIAPEKARERIRQWNKRNPEYRSFIQARRNAQKLSAILPSSDMDKIRKLYAERDRLTKEHGVAYHVDHIIPLSKGGAHHQDNMRVITATENLTKNAKLMPELGGVAADSVRD